MSSLRTASVAITMFLMLGGLARAQAPPGSITVIAGPIAQNVTDRTATIWWQTSSPAATIVRFGTRPDHLGDIAQQPWGAQSHAVELSSLQPNTTYFFELQRPSGEVLQSGQFHTLASGVQNSGQIRIVDGPRIAYLAPDQAVIEWTTNVASNAVVKYGTDPRALTQTAEEPWGRTTHRVALRGLQKNSTYYFVVQSGEARNGGGALAQSQPAMFQTYVERQAGNPASR